MRNYVLMTDSSCDLTAAMANQLKLEVLPLSLVLSGTEYLNYLDGREISFEDFYSRIRNGEISTTSAVSVGAFEEKMEELVVQGNDILCLSFSSGLSTTYQSAAIAAKTVSERHPEATIRVVDSLCASLGQGLFVYHCAKQKATGKSLDEVADYAESIKLRLCHWFTVDDLFFLKRGGRISGATALFGTMLAVKPVMHVDNEGHLVPVAKARGRKSSLRALVDHMEQTLDPKDQTVFISHGDCEADARFVADEITRRFGITDIHINYVGPVIGSHSGPGTVALFFLGKER